MSPISLMLSMSTPHNTTASDTVWVALGLGSNLPYLGQSPQEIVLAAMECLRQISIDAEASSLYCSEPIDCPPGVEDFINAAMVLRLPKSISAHELLALTQRIEADFGRQRGSVQNRARTLDIDIISYENQELDGAELLLPHPRAVARRFVLMPLAEIRPEMLLPGQSLSIAQLLGDLPTDDTVRRLT